MISAQLWKTCTISNDHTFSNKFDAEYFSLNLRSHLMEQDSPVRPRQSHNYSVMWNETITSSARQDVGDQMV